MKRKTWIGKIGASVGFRVEARTKAEAARKAKRIVNLLVNSWEPEHRQVDGLYVAFDKALSDLFADPDAGSE
jgi:hypothetical protein